MEAMINGSSICIIEKWIAIIDTHIKAQSLYVEILPDYITEIPCRYFGEEKEEKDVLFLQQDVAILLIMLEKVFPDILYSFNKVKGFPCFIIKRNDEQKNVMVDSITGKIYLIKGVIALSK